MAAMEPGLASAQGSVLDSSKAVTTLVTALCAIPEGMVALTPQAAEVWA